MNERAKMVLLVVAVGLLIGLVVKIGSHSMQGGTSEVRTSPDFLRLSPAERAKAEDEAERSRRRLGKPPFRHLPEDPPGFPPPNP